jgi:DNA-binding NarL/FixJ family response regulator
MPSRFRRKRNRNSMCKGILIADDNAPARQVMRVALERAGLTVCAEAVDGLDAVDKASELKPDLIVLDLRLPRLNGIEAAHVLRGRLPTTPIVLFTMFDVNPSLVTTAGISSIVRKSDGIHKLAASIQSILASSTNGSGPAANGNGASAPSTLVNPNRPRG